MDFASALSVGDTWLLSSLWKELGFDDAFRRLLGGKRQFDAERLLRVMVFNRLCDPESKLGIMRWLEGTLVPEVPTTSVNHQHLLRTMDTLNDCADKVQGILASLMRPLIDQELSIVFYDLTTIRISGISDQEGDIRKYGVSKDGGIARQVMLGVVQTVQGLPIHHEVFNGNQGESVTLLPTIKKILSLYPSIKRVVLVADRGLLSLDNLEEIRAIKVGDLPLEFILAVPARRYNDFDEILTEFHERQCVPAEEEVVGEMRWQEFRLIVAHSPEMALEAGDKRDAKIAELEIEGEKLTVKLEAQEVGEKFKGRKLSDGGSTAAFYKAVCEAHLAKIINVNLNSELFNYELNHKALARARLMDGKLILVTNVPDHTAEQIVARYKALADIERGFKVLKSEIEIAPVFHRLPDRIRAHALICFLALLLYRVLRMRLNAKSSAYSPERALEIARKIQYHNVTVHKKHRVSGLSTLTSQQKSIFELINLKPPSVNRL